MKKYLLITIVLSILLNCSNEKMKITSSVVGNNLSKDGDISDSSPIYTFNKYSEKGKTKDLFNYIYFKGDTLCFTFYLNKKVKKENIKVWFENPLKKTRFRAERIDIKMRNIFNISYDHKISGFSLVGSILEAFYNDLLEKTIPKNNFCCKKIPYKIILQIDDGTNKIHYEVKKYFRIKYK